MPPSLVQGTPSPVASLQRSQTSDGKRSRPYGTRLEDRAGLSSTAEKEHRDLRLKRFDNISNEGVEVPYRVLLRNSSLPIEVENQALTEERP